MQSPRFPLREAKLRPIFTKKNLDRVWRENVRQALRKQFIQDPLDHLDFHQHRQAAFDEIREVIRTGGYTPGPSRRILIEKSKGLCRQILIPNVCDAIVLQALAFALYYEIKGKAPNPNAFFEPSDEKFKEHEEFFQEPKYGSFKSWLDFQKSIFQFAHDYPYLVVTDIANFYDCISYNHLRNIISDTVVVSEPLLDMLIFVLSGMLWQPDYMPRVEIGLPQINLDAPRVLAHCFLYELDQYLTSIGDIEFTRFMDDVDIGVRTIHKAKNVLKCVDLVLQTRQVRLNSGKTRILRKDEAFKHFRVRENRFLNLLQSHINWKIKNKRPLDRERQRIGENFKRLYWKRKFDDGNGEKILKRILGISARIGVELDARALKDIVIRRPACRNAALRLISRLPPNLPRLRAATELVHTGLVVDVPATSRLLTFW